MKSLKVHINTNSDKTYTDKKQYEYTGAFYELYKQIELCADESFQKEFSKKWNLTLHEWRSLISDVKATVNSKITNDNIKQQRVNDIFEALSKKQFENIHIAFKKRNKGFELIRSVDKECCFGDTEILRKISKECNKAEDERDFEALSNWRKEWKDSRNRGFYVTGEANQKCNRFYDLSQITSGVVIYKPNKDTYIELTFDVKKYKNYKVDLEFIEEQAKLKQNHPDSILPVSVLFKNDNLIITYDEEILNGYGFDTKSYNDDVKELKKENLSKDLFKSKKKEIGAKYFKIQEGIKLQNKNKNRCIAIDMNPNYIGYAVIELIYNDDTDEYSYMILRAGCFVLKSLNKKRGYKSSDKRQKYLTNKRHHELSIIAKKLIAIAIHYQCGKFILEDLEFKSNDKNTKSIEAATKEFNRQSKNIWCRTYLEKYITKRCNETGIIIVKVCAVYSSFIGNIQHDFIDPINAAIEIARRGFLRYKENTFYPIITDKDMITLGTLFGDGLDMTVGNWKEMYNSAKSLYKDYKDFSHRWRRRIKDVSHAFEICRMNSCKSMVKHIVFH